MVFIQEFQGKRMMGHAIDAAAINLKSNKNELKKVHFSGLLFFNHS